MSPSRVRRFGTALTLMLGLVPAAAQTEIVLMTWGGAFHDAFQTVKADIEKMAGVKLTFVTQTGAACGLNRLEAQRANPQVDLWTSIVSTAVASLKNGVIEPLPAADDRGVVCDKPRDQ